MGPENGQLMFEKLQAEVGQYNIQWGSLGGKAILQPFQATTYESTDSEITDSEVDTKLPSKKRRKVDSVHQPMVLAICTPLMSRAHEMVRQAGEMIFCNSTSTLDRFNNSMFLLSCSYACCSVPLGVMIVSDERQQTIQCGFQKLLSILPSNAFFGRGVVTGPSLVMTDDSTVEREAIKSTWSGAQLLLCIFHFLQRRWTWLHDSKNKIAHKDRIDLMHIIKSMVYAKSELELNTIYAGLNTHKVGNKYPKFINHVRSLWPKRIEWATCFRNTLLIRGNNTNNYAEAGIKIIKEQVFVRIKAYNVIEMFGFITNSMEHYYQQKLLAVSNNRLDYFVSQKFLGKGATRVQQNTIECLGNATFKVQSTHRLKRDEQKFYEVDMHLGTCSCAKGIDGSPCVHQSAVVLKYKIQSVNCFPSLSPLGKQELQHLHLEARQMLT